MSATDSPASPDLDDAGHRRTGRAGKRSVSHLSKAQLARKRANDREAQRNTRQRTKEHIESLERKVKDLEDYYSARDGSPATVERVVRRNHELEAEIQNLRQQLRIVPTSPPDHDVTEPMLLPKAEWLPSSSSSWQHHEEAVAVVDTPVSRAPFADSTVYPSGSTSIGYLNEEAVQSQYAPLSTATWNSQNSHDFVKTMSDWPFAAPVHQQSRFPVHHQQHQQPGSQIDAVGSNSQQQTQPYSMAVSTSWQNQPSTYAWQITAKHKPPSSFIDHLIFSAIQTQQHLAATGEVSPSASVGYSYPPVHLLFNQSSTKAPPSSKAITDVMSQYSAVLSHRNITMIPERLGSFLCMYRFVQWHISPSFITYQKLQEWQAPRPSQLMIPHPAWMDLPPWGKFRDKIIENQDIYDTYEFHCAVASSTHVNWKGDPMRALVFVDGEMRASEEFEEHMKNSGNYTLARAFLEKYPEFKDTCRLDEV